MEVKELGIAVCGSSWRQAIGARSIGARRRAGR